MTRFDGAEIRLKVSGFLIAVVMTMLLSPQALAAEAKKINTNWLGVAIKGYDPVAYHTEGRAVKGKKEFEYKWQDAKWHFSSAANRDKFVGDPEAYAPKYGGF